MDDSHQDEDVVDDIFDDLDELDTPTPQKGDKSEELPDDAFLKRWNEVTGRNDKSVDSVKKHEAEVKKAFAEAGKKKVEGEEPEKKSTDTVVPQYNLLKTLYFDKRPEAAVYWEEVEKEAKSLNKDPFELFESSKFLQGEARARMEEKNREDEAAGKVTKPFGGRPSNNDTSAEVAGLTRADLAFLRKIGKTAKDVKPL